MSFADFSKETPMGTRTVNGVTLSYDERGPEGAPALVLLHGFPLDRRVWEAQLADLSRDVRVIAPDLRGFGKSKFAGEFTLEELADDVHALLADIDARPAVIGGLSMGGYVALAHAKKYPTDFRGLVLIDTKAEGDTTEGKQGRDKMIALVREKGSTAVADQMMPKMLAPDADKHRPDVARQLRSIMEACPPLTIAHALAAMRDRPDRVCDLPSIPVPTLIVVGEHDAITPPAQAQAMAKGIPNAQLVTVRGSGHMSPMEQPQQVNDALRKFVKQIL
jgi:pimeloyl-ACP methyl ester carboxylesterase